MMARLESTSSRRSCWWLVGLLTLAHVQESVGWGGLAVVRSSRACSPSALSAIGIFFGTSTGNTQECADKIYAALGDEFASEPIDIDSIEAGSLSDTFSQHSALIVGTPTWNTGADSQRSGTGWDDLYYKKLPALQAQLAGKKVAVFGLGDQVSYSENYADATGELYQVFQDLGCAMVPYAAWSTDGYEHQASKSLLPDSDGTLFCGLLLDQINQEEETDDRVAAWVSQLLSNGFADASFDAVQGESPVRAVAAAATTMDLEQGSAVLDESIAFTSIGGGTFVPHTNLRTGHTMWTSPDGRQSYVTSSSSTTMTTTTLRP